MQVKFKDVVGFYNINKQVVLMAHPHIGSLINMPISGSQLNYDVTSKFADAVEHVVKEFEQLHKKLLESNSVEKEIELKNGEKLKTKFRLVKAPEDYTGGNYVVKLNGKKCDKLIVKENYYDLKDLADYNKKLDELFNVEVELNCHQLRRSRFLKEDCSQISFGALKLFIKDDVPEEIEE